MADCYPSWHTKFLPYRGLRYAGGYSVPSGGDDFVPHDPETLRANAERRLRELGLYHLVGQLTLDKYSLARNIASETGSGSAEQKVAMGLTTRNQARRRGVTVHQLVTLNNRQPNRYGRIHGGGDVESAPYGRFTASSAEPTVEDLAIASFVLDGGAGTFPNDFAKGADDQAQVRTEGWIRSLARSGKYWVGHLPGVNAAKTTLFRTTDIPVESPAGQALLARGLEMLMEPPGEYAGGACVARPGGRAGKVFAAVAGAAMLGTITVLAVSSDRVVRLLRGGPARRVLR